MSADDNAFFFLNASPTPLLIRGMVRCERKCFHQAWTGLMSAINPMMGADQIWEEPKKEYDHHCHWKRTTGRSNMARAGSSFKRKLNHHRKRTTCSTNLRSHKIRESTSLESRSTATKTVIWKTSTSCVWKDKKTAWKTIIVNTTYSANKLLLSSVHLKCFKQSLKWLKATSSLKFSFWTFYFS